MTSGADIQRQKPSLVLLISIDQMRGDYYDRYRADMRGGLRRLFEEGALFTNAHHDHGITETAPGHATLLSGRFPRATGITRNNFGVRDMNFPLIGARDSGASPLRFRGTTLVDWMIKADPATKVLSVSAKDRSAILPVGRSKQSVYWYANNGTLTTSSYYGEALPAWVNAFNARRMPHRMAGRAWTTLPDMRYTEPDTVAAERPGRRNVFPHTFSNDTAVATAQFRRMPFVDELTLQFALTGVKALGLGAGASTDILSISLSATDYVGHDFGPESREQHDNLVRLDRSLGAFLDSLYALRGRERVLIALSADHGVALVPELHGQRRISLRPVELAAAAFVQRRGGRPEAVDLETGAFFVDSTALGNRGLTVREVSDTLVTLLRAVPGVMRADRFSDLSRADTTRDAISRRWLHMFPDDQRPAVVITTVPGDTYTGDAGKHGSPHDYDSNVPLVFHGSRFTTGRHARFVRTVDLAATLAASIGVTPMERLDGRVLSEALRR